MTISYDKELCAPHLLSKDELASQVRRYVETFNLNIITSAEIKSTQYDMSTERWDIEIDTPAGKRKISSKQLVLATGFGSQKPNMPYIPGKKLYKGTSIHSAQFKSGMDLNDKGIKSVVVIGSANTAFDVLEDCHAAGLQSTMNVRTPTYMVPLQYVCHKMSLGAYDAGVEASDNRFLLLPTVVDGQLARNLFRLFASQEPNRYEALKTAGFPALDSSDPSQALMHNLLERAGGHYVDVGGTKLIEDGKIVVKANVEPVAYTATGLQFSDGSVIESDAIVWCTGFADGNLRQTGAEILGAGASKVEGKKVLGPEEIVARLEVTWGVDAEGEIRGCGSVTRAWTIFG
ncbi:Monooxygenase [Penicillium waksmanii]|uniref:Monooxygenase n=1 Tax=Penicillium waksmanii TaxID=69791 RepID=UPI00254898D4|nr:Monooxygenase [Penicillium waksmanii]KAJ5980851.1 Monooxygenase [Penicillium waksmanii]